MRQVGFQYKVDLIWIWYDDDDNFLRIDNPPIWDWIGETMINGLQDTPRWVVDSASSFQHNLARSRSRPVEVDEKYKLRENTNFRRFGQILASLSPDLFTHSWYVTFVV